MNALEQSIFILREYGYTALAQELHNFVYHTQHSDHYSAQAAAWSQLPLELVEELDHV